MYSAILHLLYIVLLVFIISSYDLLCSVTILYFLVSIILQYIMLYHIRLDYTICCHIENNTSVSQRDPGKLVCCWPGCLGKQRGPSSQSSTGGELPRGTFWKSCILSIESCMMKLLPLLWS